MSKLISEKGNYKLFRPLNSWDMNYHLVNTKENLDHLIDIGEVYDMAEIEDINDFDGLLWDELKELNDIDYILEYSWKTTEW